MSQIESPVLPALAEWESEALELARGLRDLAETTASSLIYGLALRLCTHVEHVLDPALNRDSRLDDGMRRYNWEADYRRVERFCKGMPHEWDMARLGLTYFRRQKAAILQDWARLVYQRGDL